MPYVGSNPTPCTVFVPAVAGDMTSDNSELTIFVSPSQIAVLFPNSDGRRTGWDKKVHSRVKV